MALRRSASLRDSSVALEEGIFFHKDSDTVGNFTTIRIICCCSVVLLSSCQQRSEQRATLLEFGHFIVMCDAVLAITGETTA